MSNKYMFKGIRNALIGAIQFAMPLPHWLLIVMCVVLFGTSIGWFYRAFHPPIVSTPEESKNG